MDLKMKPLTWLHKEGSWYILNEDQCSSSIRMYPHNSLIWHECSVRSKGPPHYRGCWRGGGNWMGAPCPACDEACPEGLAALWRFHNWDTLDTAHIMSIYFYGCLQTKP